MNEKIKGIWEKIKEFIKKIPRKVYIALAVILVAALAIVIFLNTRPYQVLFADLNATDFSSIINYLDSNGITDYRVENGDTILVPEKQEANLKMQVMKEGYPQSGFAYTYSGTSGAFSTEAERSAAEIRDLQDRLSAVVRCFDGVKDAAVTISAGDDNRYILDSNNTMEATASVLLSMRDGQMLNEEYADAIRNLIAHSVKGLKIDSVSVMDTAGNTYGSGDSMADGEASALKIKLEAEWENKVRGNILQVLTPYYGADNVRVGVNCTVDVSQTIEDSTDVFLPDWAADGSTNGHGIVGSRIYDYIVVQDDNETEGGVAGTSTNSDFPEYVEDLPGIDGDESEIHSSGQVDYENSKTQKHVIRTAGYLTDCTISVSINSRTASNFNEEEIAQHIARAAGITGKVDPTTGVEDFSNKISIMAMPFYDDDEPVIPIAPGATIENWMLYAIVGGVILLLILIITVIIVSQVKRKKKKKARIQAEKLRQQMEMQNPQQPAMVNDIPEVAEVLDLQMEKSVELRQNIRDFAEENPEIAAQMIRTWLRGDDDDG